jgi:type IV pilus assembly protein PilY1
MKRTGNFHASSRFAALLAVLLAMLLAALPAGADDTEIYFSEAPPDAPPPLVMLTLDLRPNLGSAFCSEDVATASCRDKFCESDENCDIGQGIYDALYPGAPQDADGIYTGAGGASGAVNQRQTFVAAFRYLLFNLGTFDDMRVGLMMNHNSENGCDPVDTGCSNGGYVLRGFELLEKGSDSNGAKQELLDIFAALPDMNASEVHKYQGRELFFEMYRYMAGLDVLNAKLGYTDFGSALTARNLDHEFTVGGSGTGAAAGPPKCLFSKTSITGDNRQCLDYIGAGAAYSIGDDSNYRTVSKDKGSCPPGSTAVGGSCYSRISSALTWDPTIIKIDGSPPRDRYISPYDDDEKWACSGAYSINMLFGVSNQDTDNDTALEKPLAEQGLGVPKATGGVDGFSQVIAKLNQMDIAGGQVPGVVPSPAGRQNLKSWFLTADNGPVISKGNDYAAAGDTGNAIPALDNPGKLVEALGDVGRQINAVSSSFVAVTVPVNADNRVTSLPNVFVALFQVDENGKPLWPGNLKKLDVVTTTLDDGSKQLDVLDALGKPAFNPITGRIDDNALTLWTVPTAADVVAADTSKGEISGRDGSSVRRGGAGHKTPGYRSGSVGEQNADVGARQIFLEPETFDPLALAGNAPVPLDASADTGALREDEDVQTRFGFRDTSISCTLVAAPYCMTAIDKVLDAANAQPTGSPSNDEKAQVATQVLLRWIRGFDVFNTAGNSGSPNGLTTMVQRKWLMGDVLHSRPVAINYGARPPAGSGYSEDNQDVRLVFGANDGLLRMVRNTMPGAAMPDAVTQQGDDYGEEVWAFMPREVLSHVPRLAMTTTDVGVNRPYGVDGESTLFTIDTNGDGIIDNDSSCTVGAVDCDRAWIYFGLRRGGKAYYAVDVSNPDAAAPKLMWKIDDDTAGFTELGLTFSTPRVGWVQFEDDPANQFDDPADSPDLGVTNVPVPVVIFGGGYHGHAVEAGDHHDSAFGGPSKDTIIGTPFTGADTDEGNAVFLVHARTGELIWKVTGGTGTDTATQSFHADMDHGFAAAVSPMDADGDNILDRLYIPDTGGRVWRIDIPQYVPGVTPGVTRAANWKASVLADLRPSDAELATSTDNDLRFFHAATIVRRARDGIGTYDAIAVGSGDREHPQSETNKNNWFFLFKDRAITSGDPTVATRTPLAPSDLLDVTDICLNVTAGVACTGDLSNGWRLALEETGEKNLSTPFIGGNGIIFTTYLPEGSGPDDDPCSPLGTSRLYQVGLEAGEPLRFLHDVVGDTFSKTDRWINLYSGIDGGVVAVSPDFWITASGKSGKNPPQKPIQFYWRESGVDTVQ